jgi:hypothetical protein
MVCEFILTRGKNKGKICGKNHDVEKFHKKIITCNHVIERGKNKGNECGKKNCKKHMKILCENCKKVIEEKEEIEMIDKITQMIDEL